MAGLLGHVRPAGIQAEIHVRRPRHLVVRRRESQADREGVRMAAEARGQVSGTPRVLLRLEGLVLGVLCIWLFAGTGASWWLFAALILAPDLGMLGYLANPRLGATIYNA